MRHGKRIYRNKLKKKKELPKGYDSQFEYDLHLNQLKGCEFHTEKLPYTVIKSYQPDFVFNDDMYTIFIESKGRFRDSQEASKYLWIKKSLPWTAELVFVFQNPKTPMPSAKKRKDGTKFTVSEWADKHGFRWYSPDTVPKEWSKK